MFHVPSVANTGQSFNFSTNNEHPSLDLIRKKHPSAVSPSPENSPSSSPGSVSSSTISSLNAWRGASEQSSTSGFALPDLVFRNFEAITANPSDELSNHCVQMSASDAPPPQGQILPSVDESELDNLRWSTGVPCHMMDVFRANPFAAMNLSRTNSTTPSSLDNSTDADSLLEFSDNARPVAKRTHSPVAVEQKKKCRTKRARIQSPPVVPFPATGPQEMFAYEFRLDIPHENTSFFCVEDYPRGRDLPPSYSWSGTMNGLVAPRPVVAYRPEDTCMRLAMGDENFPSRLSYPYSRSALIPQKAGPEHRIQSSYHPLFPSVPHSTPVPSCLRATSNTVASSSQLAADGSWSRFEEYACNPPPAAVPMQVLPERIQASRPLAIPAALSMQKQLYACPLCPRDFQLPNGLALHLKWHERVGGSIKNAAPRQSQPVGHQSPPRVPHMESSPLDVRGLGLTQLPIQDTSQGGSTSSGFPSPSYTALQGANPAPAGSVSRSSECRPE